MRPRRRGQTVNSLNAGALHWTAGIHGFGGIGHKETKSHAGGPMSLDIEDGAELRVVVERLRHWVAQLQSMRRLSDRVAELTSSGLGPADARLPGLAFLHARDAEAAAMTRRFAEWLDEHLTTLAEEVAAAASSYIEYDEEIADLLGKLRHELGPDP